MVGDVRNYPDSDALKETIKGIRGELSKQQAEREAIAEAKAKEIAEQQAAAKKLEDLFNAKLTKVEQRVASERQKREALEEELEALRKQNEKLSTRAYAESRLSNHPKAAKLRSLVESVNVESEDDVDSIIESEREPERDADDLQEVRARIRGKMRGGVEHAEELTENRSPAKLSKDFMGLGTSLEQLQRLSGISR
jgi:chromosome segregation ATPase